MPRWTLALTALALLLTGCAETKDTASSPDSTPTNQSDSTPDVKPTEQDTAAAEDVKITKCDANSWTQTVGLEITNSTDEPWKYVVGVRIKGGDGATSEARFVENRIDAGKTHKEDIPGDTPLKGAITCEVEEAKRMAPL